MIIYIQNNFKFLIHDKYIKLTGQLIKYGERKANLSLLFLHQCNLNLTHFQCVLSTLKIALTPNDIHNAIWNISKICHITLNLSTNLFLTSFYFIYCCIVHFLLLSSLNLFLVYAF